MDTKLKENISLWQFFVITVIFELGSSIVIGIARYANQDAWIAIALATLPGFVLIWLYHILLARAPGKNLFEILEIGFGRFLAVIISIAYSVYFFYLSAFVMRDFVEMINSAILFNTPSGVVALCMMFVVAYLLYLGLEVIGRIAEIFTPYILGFICLISLFLLVTGKFYIKNLQPVLAEGFQPIINIIFPQLLGFPIGEIPIIFTVIMTHVSKFTYSRKVGIYALGTGSLILIWSSILQVAVLGVDVTARSNFPLLSAARMISLVEFIERIDAVIVFIMMLGILIKISVFTFIGLKGLEYVFRIPYRSFVFPMCIIVAIFSIVHAENMAEHLTKGGDILPAYFHMPFQIYIPMLTFLVVIWKQRKSLFQKGGN